MTMKSLKVGVVQLTSGLDPWDNLNKIQKFLDESSNVKLDACFLPECFLSMSDGLGPTPYLVEHGNNLFEAVKDLAMKYQVYLIGGSVAYLENGKVLNRVLDFDPNGDLIGFYDKIHLFSCNISSRSQQEKVVLNEGQIYEPGHKMSLLNLGDFKIGQTICFDIRFPELYRKLFHQGANVFSISSAFTVPTGQAHWEVLVRARAIENQSYVIASAQWGENNKRIKTFGHTLVVDPWGEVIAKMEDGEGIVYADLSIDKIQEIRQRMNVFNLSE